MAQYKLHINFKRIPKERLYRKSGKDGAYGDIMIIETPNGTSDCIVKMALSDDEFREGRTVSDLPIIGCGRKIEKKEA